LESQLATRNKFHLIIATELGRYFTDAGRGLRSEFMRSQSRRRNTMRVGLKFGNSTSAEV
jgi:hypothetical protein